MNNVISLILVILVLILGFLLGFFFSKIIFLNIKYIGPNSKDIKKNIYKSCNGECYKLIPEICITM